MSDNTKKDVREIKVPENLEWHHRMFQMLGIHADEYNIVTFAFPKPQTNRTIRLEIQHQQKNQLAKKLSELKGKPIKIPDDGILRMPIESAFAILDDEYETEVRPASVLFMRVEYGKPYDFVIAYKYELTGRQDVNGEEILSRKARVLFLEPLNLSKREWTDPDNRFSIKSEVIFYPSVTRRGQPQIATVHPSGKWIIVNRDQPKPPIGEPVTVRLIEKFSILEAIPYRTGLTTVLSEQEMEAREQKALATNVMDKVELRPGHVFDGGDQSPAWDALNRHWAQLHKKTELIVFSEDMEESEFKSIRKKMLAMLHTDKIANQHPAVVRTRNQRYATVSHFLDVMENYLEDRSAKVKAVTKTVTTNKGNGQSKKPAKKAAAKKPVKIKPVSA